MHGGDELVQRMDEIPLCTPPQAEPLAQPQLEHVRAIHDSDQPEPSGDDLSMSGGGEVTTTASEVESSICTSMLCVS